jgi:hypothetical protein
VGELFLPCANVASLCEETNVLHGIDSNSWAKFFSADSQN